jgi:uncharacterized iron-regulated protein
MTRPHPSFANTAFACLLGALLASMGGCATAPELPPLHGATLALLGEVHDNPAGHRERLALLTRAVGAGWRSVIAMEQFDTDRQADIDRARREAPRDAQHVIDLAAPARSGWDWAFYRPVIELALRYDLPLRAANLSAADTGKVVRGGYASVFDAARLAALGLAEPIDPATQGAQEREIDAGHCGMLPAPMWPAMARAQFARDAVMAQVLREAGANGANRVNGASGASAAGGADGASGAVLIAGNGHVRRDIGVARWLGADERARVVAIGFVEAPVSAEFAAAFDRVVPVPAAPRADPCAAFAKRAAP